MALACALFVAPAAPAELEGVKLPDQWTLAGRTLVLNGYGVRTYSIFRVNVYVAGLYLAAREADAERILGSAEPRVFHMQFKRAIGRDDTLTAWDYAFEKNCVGSCRLPGDRIEAFKALIPASRSGETQTYIFHADRVDILGNGKVLGTVPGADFSRLLLSTLLGPVPPTPELKRALLGN
ncbi:MAG: chalcone isomerase family protein [Nevskiaceae bacterium]